MNALQAKFAGACMSVCMLISLPAAAADPQPQATVMLFTEQSVQNAIVECESGSCGAPHEMSKLFTTED